MPTGVFGDFERENRFLFLDDKSKFWVGDFMQN